MRDDQWDDQLRESVQDYNAPPETPRAEMWQRIAAARAGKAEAKAAEKGESRQARILPFRPFRSFRRYRLPIGIAALLALGIGLGRLTVPFPQSGTPPAVVVTPTPAAPAEVAYQVATTEHLSQSEAFLTLFRASVHRGGNEQLASATARQLLGTNRLLLDSPAGSDVRTRLLLQDLELVLVQIAQLSPRPSSPDLDLITQGLEGSDVMSRLRTAVPSGISTTQGVL